MTNNIDITENMCKTLKIRNSESPYNLKNSGDM